MARTRASGESSGEVGRQQALLQALKAQQRRITELTELSEQQADAMAGLVLVLRGFLDIALEENQRKMLKGYIASLGEDSRGDSRSLIKSLLD